MNAKELLNFPLDVDSALTCEVINDKVKFTCRDVASNWISVGDEFIKRIQYVNLNEDKLDEHLACEIRVKNRLDEGNVYLKNERYPKAIACFDEVLYYDPVYGQALMNKSHALCGQRHYVKALRYYKKALDAGISDEPDYYKLLLDRSREERDSFPKIKLNIYAGDEHFTRGDYASALESYNRALEDSSAFKEKILFKLLNKKATVLFYLGEFRNALECFEDSLKVRDNDYANFGKGYSLYRLSMENPKNQACESCLERIYVDQIRDSFKKAVKINKKQLLIKADIMYDLGCAEDAFEYYDEFLKVHFIQDNDYIKASEGLEILR